MVQINHTQKFDYLACQRIHSRKKKKSIYLVLFLNKSEEDKYANAMLSIGKAFHMY